VGLIYWRYEGNMDAKEYVQSSFNNNCPFGAIIFLNFLLQLVSIKIQKSSRLLSGLRASLKDWIQELVSSIKSLFDTR
jgi:hypothetical protein